MIIAIFIGAAILGLAIHFLGPKDFWKKDLWEIAISRTSISLLISTSILGLSFLNFFYISDPLSNSGIRTFIDIILGIPMAIPFIFGFSEGDEYAIAAMMVEIVFMTFIFRLFISKNWTERLREKIKKTLHNNGYS
ncbi:hypothetical protein GYB57_15690 [bacterium]|nr:hypothetical protein [bacterium]